MGVDAHSLGEHYLNVLKKGLQSDPDLIVICNDKMGDLEFELARRAFESGHLVMLVNYHTQAPEGTRWLSK